MARVTRPLELVRSAESAGCTISPEDASAQVAGIEALRPHVVVTERRPGWLSLSFAAAADAAAIDRLIEVERGCCDLLRIEREHVGGHNARPVRDRGSGTRARARRNRGALRTVSDGR